MSYHALKIGTADIDNAGSADEQIALHTLALAINRVTARVGAASDIATKVYW